MKSALEREAEAMKLISGLLEERGECLVVFDGTHRDLRVAEFRSLGRKIGRERGWKISTRAVPHDDGGTIAWIGVIKADGEYESRWKARDLEAMQRMWEMFDAKLAVPSSE